MTWEQKFGQDSARIGCNPKAEQHGDLRSTPLAIITNQNGLRSTDKRNSYKPLPPPTTQIIQTSKMPLDPSPLQVTSM